MPLALPHSGAPKKKKHSTMNRLGAAEKRKEKKRVTILQVLMGDGSGSGCANVNKEAYESHEIKAALRQLKTNTNQY